MLLVGKTALVTGAGQGIGLGCAMELARAGASLVINDRPGSEQLAAAVQQIRAIQQDRPTCTTDASPTAAATCHAIEADVFSRQGCQQLVSAAVATAGRIDILVSNPAYSRRGTFLQYCPQEFERTINGTLTSGFHMSQLVARHMVSLGIRGHILFISSVQAEMPFALCAAYGAAKAGLNQMTKSIAVELAEHRINVNAIEPGWIDTPSEHVTFSDQVLEQHGKKLPWGRLGNPGDIGKAAAFLCSDAADYITGTVLPVDGGFRFKDCGAEPIRTQT